MQNNSIHFISFNSCNMDTFTLCTGNSLQKSPNRYQVDFYSGELNQEQIKEFDPEGALSL